VNIDEQITYEADEQALQLSTKGEVVSIRLTRSDAPIRVNGKVRLGPSGVHLFNRATGLNVLLDEVQVPASSWAAAPRQVAVALTNACDLACPHCYAPKSPAALNFQRLTGWLKELDAHGCLGVGFGGGEPTLYRRFTELCRYTAQETGL
jgi:hypothetical protein